MKELTVNVENVFEQLPTGKPHISFSEVREWDECSYRHKLKHVKKIDLGKPGPMLDFGTAVHAACEDFLKTRTMNVALATDFIKESWEKNKDVKGFEPAGLPKFLDEATSILNEVPEWFNTTFPNWELVDAEHFLYEPIDARPHAFKGYIDVVIKCKDDKGRENVWLLDWKTCSFGWTVQKKSDAMVKSQLILYKNYWTKKTDWDPKKTKCGFVLLKRTAKNGNRCELVPVSVGEVTTKRALKVVDNMIVSVKKGIALKNRSSCTYCDYKDTEHCK